LRRYPPQHLEAVLRNVQALREKETERIAALQSASTAEEVKAILSGHTYGEDREQQR
jgi:muramoyltetrapeptide carboxypeptidase LdcA involved in peptidoglycan recycling